MGYYVDLIDADWIVPENESVFKAMADLNVHDDLKRGGSWGPDGMKEKWFSWMPADYDTKYTTVQEILENLGFTVYVNDEITVEHPYNRLRIAGYSSKTGQEDLFIEAMAPFVKDGSYMEWRGEDGELWRWEVKDKKLFYSEGKVVYSDPTPYSALDMARQQQEILNAIRKAT